MPQSRLAARTIFLMGVLLIGGNALAAEAIEDPPPGRGRPFRPLDRRRKRSSVRGELALRTFTIEGTIQIFRKGKIAIASTVFSERDNAYAVTGGTGAYKGVGGELSAFDWAAGTRCSSSTWLLAGRGRRPLMDGAPVRSGRFPEGIDAGLPLGFVRARE